MSTETELDQNGIKSTSTLIFTLRLQPKPAA